MWREAYKLDLHEGFVAVIKQVAGLSAVDPHDTEQKLAAQTEGHWSLALVDNGMDAGLDVGLENVALGELALKVGGEPDTSQRAGLGQESLGVEHGWGLFGGCWRKGPGGWAGTRRVVVILATRRVKCDRARSRGNTCRKGWVAMAIEARQ